MDLSSASLINLQPNAVMRSGFKENLRCVCGRDVFKVTGREFNNFIDTDFDNITMYGSIFD